MHCDVTVMDFRCGCELSSHKSPRGWDGREGSMIGLEVWRGALIPLLNMREDL